MYGLLGSPIQFGVKRAKQKPGRKSAQAKFLEQQKDLFPVDLYTSKLTAVQQAARLGGEKRAVRPQRSEDGGAQRRLPPATKRGGKVNKDEGLEKLKAKGYSEKDLEESNPFNTWTPAL